MSQEKKKDMNQYFDDKFGSHDADTVAKILDQKRAAGELQAGTRVITVEKPVEKVVGDDYHGHHYLEDEYRTPQEKADIERSKEIAEGLRALFSQPMHNRDSSTLWDCQPTISELQTKAAVMPKKQLEEAVTSTSALLEESKTVVETTKKAIMEAQKTLYGFSDTPTVKAKLDSEVDEIMVGAGPAFEKIAKLVPHLEEIKQVYVQALADAEKVEVNERAKEPDVLRQMEQISKDAEKLYAKIEKANAEYLKMQTENNLTHLASLVNERNYFEASYYELRKELRHISPQPQFPPMPDLPALPYKIWKKVDEIQA